MLFLAVKTFCATFKVCLNLRVTSEHLFKHIAIELSYALYTVFLTQAHPVLQKGTACFYLPAIMINPLVKISQNITMPIFRNRQTCKPVRWVFPLNIEENIISLKMLQEYAVVLVVYMVPLLYHQLTMMFPISANLIF